MTFRPSMKSLKAFAAAAFASAAMFGSSAQAEHIDWNFLQGSPVRFESQSSVGNQPGVQRGYQRTGAFVSVFEDPSSILFIDAHGNVNYDSGNWSGDVGVGYRQDVGSAVIGGNAYYNYREYSNGFVDHNFSTLGFGAEALMYDWSVRSNAFFAIDGRESNGRTAFPIPGGPDYVPEAGASMGVQNIRLATQTENFDEALDGFDLSVSRKIYQARTEVGAGVYYLSAGGGPNAWGVSGTAETWITSNISGNINVSNDSLFDTTVFGGVSMYFGGRNIDVDSRSHTVESRLWSRVQRRHVAPVLNYTTDAPDLLATDPGTGDLISVVQLGDMDDIVGAPALMEADGDFVDIILADPDSTFAPTATIALNDGQRLLSGHIFHEVDTTEVGVIQLPETDLGGAAAFIENMVTGIDVITLANDNEVSGFMIQAGTLANGIAGADVSGFDINRNIIPGAGSNGVSIDSSGIATLAGVFSDNTITDSELDGVVLIGNDIDVDFFFNTISSNGNDNVDIEAGGEYSGFIVGNTLNAATGGSGFEVSSGTIAASFIDNAANENEFSGIDIVVDNTTPGFVLLLEDNTTNLNGLTNMTGGDGVSITFNGDDDSEVFIDDNTADGNDGDGISVVSTGMGDILGTITNNTTNGNDPGIFVQSNNAASNIILDIIGNVSSGNTQEGILIDSANDFFGEVKGNTTSLNGDAGLSIVAANNIAGEVSENSADANGGAGILLDSAGTIGVMGAPVVVDNNMVGTLAANGDFGIRLEAPDDIFANIVDNMALDSGDDNISVLTNNGAIRGLIQGNTANGSTGGSGIMVRGETEVASLVNMNTANGNDQRGIVVETRDGDVTGDITNNTTNGNMSSGLRVRAGNAMGMGSITGDVTGNTADDNMIDGISLEAMTNVEGNVSGNTAINNRDGIFIDAAGDLTGNVSDNFAGVDSMAMVGANSRDGISIVATNITGDITGNNASNNMRTGIFTEVSNNFSGNVSGNTANDNGGAGIVAEADADLSGAGDFTGNVTGNTANGNMTNNGILVSGANINSQITGNTTNDNTSDAGLRVAADGNIAGLIDDNTSHGNATNGIEVVADLDADNVGDVTATVSNNTAGVMGNGNGINGLLITGENLFGNVTGNTAHANTGDGISIDVVNDIGTAMSAVLLDGNAAGVDGMMASGNGGFGIRIASGSDIFATINDNDAHHNERGLTVVTPSGTITGDVTNNRANNNAMNGVHITGLPLFTSFVGDVTGNTGNGNGLVGVRVDNLFDINSNLTGNTGNGNLVGIFVEADNDFTGNFGDVMNAMLGNNADLNADNGIFFDIGNDFIGDFANNSAIGNFAPDYDTSAGGAVMGTTSPNSSTTNTAADFLGNIATP